MEPKKASPGPWKWHADGRLLDANGRGVPFAENMELFALSPTMASMLRELEYSGSPAGECPMCGGQPEREITVGAEPIPGTFLVKHGTGTKRTLPAYHAPDCRLAALLKELP